MEEHGLRGITGIQVLVRRGQKWEVRGEWWEERSQSWEVRDGKLGEHFCKGLHSFNGATLFVCQACSLSIGWESRTRVAVLIVSSRQGCLPWGKIWRKLAANIRAYEQKLHKRRGHKGDVAKETEARYCTDCDGVNEEATWIERQRTYPERSVYLNCRWYARMPEK